jgi:hypothetical protein
MNDAKEFSKKDCWRVTLHFVEPPGRELSLYIMLLINIVIIFIYITYPALHYRRRLAPRAL